MSVEITKDQREQLERLAAMPDSEIDTSDIPEVLDWRGAIRGSPTPTRRMRLAACLDNDVIEWFERRHTSERDGADEISAVLKSHMDAEAAKQK